MGTRYQAVLQFSRLAVALLASAGWACADDSVTIPSAAQAGEGNSDNQFPFNGNPIRYQQVILASEFFSASEFPPEPRMITRIAMRPDAATGAAFSETLSNVQINLSTTPKAPGSLSENFADNIGSDEVVVYSGELPLSSACSGPDGGPKDFDIIITLKTPFLYDPRAGNLLLDVRNFFGGRTTQLDAHIAADSMARIWSRDLQSQTATQEDPFPSMGLVLRFLSN
jgi:hypothetical protein